MTGVEAADRYDIFISYSQEDSVAASELEVMFRQAGLTVWYAPYGLRDNLGQPDWETYLFGAIDRSQNLGVYASSASLQSGWVLNEVRHFLTAQEDHGTHRRLFVIRDPKMSVEELETRLEDIPEMREMLRPDSQTHVLQFLTKRRIEQLSGSLTTATDLARQAFQYYRHARFWRPFAAEGQRLHVFTCGRDTAEESGHRGHGGRTNIDIWDYRTAVDLTHHFARHHREIGVQIEQPVSKAIIDATTRTYDTTRFSRRLIDQNCVIIGSPDVSDFAEILLAEIVGVEPYHPEIDLGATLIKFLKSGRSHSTFYSDPGKGDDAVEGIQVIDAHGVHTYANTPNTTHGVIVLADNPFPLPESDFGGSPTSDLDDDRPRTTDRPRAAKSVLILAGHTGIATRAMSLLLTDDADVYLDEFYGLDQEIALTPGPVAAIVEVNYRRSSSRGNPDNRAVGDNRSIERAAGSIRFKRVVRLAD